MIIEEVQKLAFKQYGQHAGQTQIDYLTEDLKMDSSHSVEQFFRILTCHLVGGCSDKARQRRVRDGYPTK